MFPEATIKEEFKKQETKGIHSPISKKIVLYERSSHTIFHELGHYITKSVLSLGDQEYAKNEVLAELSAYLLMIRFDENIDYDFKYSNVWSNRITNSFKLNDFKQYFKKLTTYLSIFKRDKEIDVQN